MDDIANYLHILHFCFILFPKGGDTMDLPFTAYCRTDSRWNMIRPHLHGEMELLFPLTDGDDIFIDSVSYPLRRGSLFLMDAGVPHRSRADKQPEYHRYVLHLPPETAQALGAAELSHLLAEKGCCALLTPEEDDLCRRLFARLTANSTTVAAQLRRTAALAELLALILDKWSTDAAQPPTAADPTAAAIIAYIRTHLSQPLTLDTLTQQFYLSKSALCHRFKAATGFTVMEYVVLCRVRYAGTLLRRGVSVRRAGEAAGFGDNAHFIRSFRRITGTTPGRYAKEDPT